jgi:transposase
VHPQTHLAGYAGLMQADAYAGFNRLYEPDRRPGPIVEAVCWAHARRKLFDLARLRKAPIAIEAVARIDALFAIEREINGLAPEQRLRVRRERSRPLVAALETWLREQRAKLSAKSDTAKAIDYGLRRWDGLVRFLDDGRLCMSNNAAERALRGIAVGRHNCTFAGSDQGGRRAAAIYTLIETAKLNDVDPEAWLRDVLARLATHPAKHIDQLLPWAWPTHRRSDKAAA